MAFENLSDTGKRRRTVFGKTSECHRGTEGGTDTSSGKGEWRDADLVSERRSAEHMADTDSSLSASLPSVPGGQSETGSVKKAGKGAAVGLSGAGIEVYGVIAGRNFCPKYMGKDRERI